MLADSSKADSQITTEDVQAVLNENKDLCSGISTFEFNIFEFSRVVGRSMQMPAMATAIIEMNGLTQKIDQGKFL